MMPRREAGSYVITKNNGVFAIFRAHGVDKLKHVLLMFQMPQMWG